MNRISSMKSFIYITVTIIAFFLFIQLSNSNPPQTTNIEQKTKDSIDNFWESGKVRPFKGTILFDQTPDEERLAEILRGNDPSPDAQFLFDRYRLIIHNYGLEDTRINYNELIDQKGLISDEYRKYDIVVRGFNDYDIIANDGGDTLHLYENVFEDLSYKLIQIIPIDKNNRFEVSISASMNINEQYDYRNPIHREDNWWTDKALKWFQYSSYTQIPDSARYFYRIPLITDVYTNDFNKAYKDLNLRDTLIDLSGESSNVATLIYKNKPATFYVKDGLIRIKKFDKNNRLVNTQYLSIEFSYGC